MSLLSIFDVSGSAMSAETVRLNTTASNLANAQSVTSNFADTYRARHPVFAAQAVSGADGDSAEDGAETRGVQVLGIVEQPGVGLAAGEQRQLVAALQRLLGRVAAQEHGAAQDQQPHQARSSARLSPT